MDDRDQELVTSKLQQGRIGIEVRVTGFLGREVLAYSEEQISIDKDWSYSRRRGHLSGPTLFTVLPLERYRVSTSIGGENAFLEEREILLALSADRDTGYHSLIYMLLYWLSGVLFAFIVGIWAIVKVISFVTTRR